MPVPARGLLIDLEDHPVNILKTPIAALVLVVVVPVGIFVHIEWGPGGAYPGDEFFDLAAQTIPILLVALAVEAQARRFDESAGGKWMRLAAVGLLSVGEISAILISAGLLDPLYGSLESTIFIVLAAAGLIGGFIGVIAVALLPFKPAPEPSTGPTEQVSSSALPPARPVAGSPAYLAATLAAVASLIGALMIGLLARDR